MMNESHEELIEKLIEELKHSKFDFKLLNFLKSRGIEGEKAKEYIQEAKNRNLERKLERLPKFKKMLFGVFLTLTVISFYYGVFVIPDKSIDSAVLVAVLMGVLIVGFGLTTFFFYKSWTRERLTAQLKNGVNPETFGVLGVIGLIPVVIISFIIHWRIGSGQDRILNKTKVEVVGTIVDGSSYTVRRRGAGTEFSSVTVEFTTKEGRKMRVKEDVPSHEYERIAKGQKVRMIYSSINPQNIALFLSDYEVKKHMKSEERQMTMGDVERLSSLNQNETLENLNKIAYGWEYNPEIDMFVNDRKSLVVTKRGGGEVLMAMDNKFRIYFVSKMKDWGYTRVGENANPGPFAGGEFTSDNYSVLLGSTKFESRMFLTIELSPK